MVSPYQTAVFTLGDRHSVVDFMGAEPLLPSILASEGRFVSFPELFRSVQQHLIACALAEFEFEVQFFNVEDSALFIDVFGGACELLHLGAVEWIRGSYDIVGVDPELRGAVMRRVRDRAQLREPGEPRAVGRGHGGAGAGDGQPAHEARLLRAGERGRAAVC